MPDVQPVGVGEVLGAYGIAGGVRVRPLTKDRARGRSLRDVLAVREGEEPRRLRVAAVREAEGTWLVTFEGISTREEAETLRGLTIAVMPAESPPLPEGTWYVHDIVGREVVAEDGAVLGRVTGVVPTGANDCWEIAGAAGELLFPALRDLVVSVPGGGGPITVRVPPGLLDTRLPRRKE